MRKRWKKELSLAWILAERIKLSPAVHCAHIKLEDGSYSPHFYAAVLQSHLPAQGGRHEPKFHAAAGPARIFVEPLLAELHPSKAPERFAPRGNLGLSREFEDSTDQSMNGRRI